MFNEDFFINIETNETTKDILMPYHPRENEEYYARDYQIEFWDMFEYYTEEDCEMGFCSKEMVGELKFDHKGQCLKETLKRIIFVWHRRAGKDFDTWQRFLTYASVCPGIYYYFLPTAAQARRVIFDGQSEGADKFIDFLNPALIKGGKWNKSDMKCELINGSLIQILGSDNYDGVVGANPSGVVFSEYALCDPTAWSYIRPMLLSTNGFAWFVSTPRGKNHLYDLIQNAKKPENKGKWNVSIKTATDTGVFTEEQLQGELDDGMEESKYMQEYFCDFDVPIKGSYYSEAINRIYKDERFCFFPINTALPVKVALDIGVNDKTSMVFWQQTKTQFEIIGYYENNSVGLEHYVRYIHEFQRKNNVAVSDVYFPHDMNVKEFAGGQKRIHVARKALPNVDVHVLKKSSVAEGIDNVRRVLPLCKFRDDNDPKNCKYLLGALASYHREYDEKRKEYKDNPVHDWSSHPSDAMRYMAMVAEKELTRMNAGKNMIRNNMINKGSII